jgi:alpha-tubulin suppressor-like RCC1 family protein
MNVLIFGFDGLYCRSYSIKGDGGSGTVANNTIEIYQKVLYHDDNVVALGNDTQNYKFLKKETYKSVFEEKICSVRDLLSINQVTVKKLHFGSSYAVAEAEDGYVLFVSDIFHLPTSFVSSLPIKLDVKSITCGNNRCLILASGGVYSVGVGNHGELGLGERIVRTEEFIRISSLPSNEVAFNIAVGPNHSCILTKPYGFLYTFGCGAYYRLGHGDDENCYIPRRVELLTAVGSLNEKCLPTGVKMVACGTWHTIAVANGSNDVYGWGLNKFGQVGIDAGIGNIIEEPERLSILENLFDEACQEIVKVCCGSRFSCFLLSTHEVVVTGKLGQPNLINGVDRDMEEWKSYLDDCYPVSEWSQSSDYELCSLEKGVSSETSPRFLNFSSLSPLNVGSKRTFTQLNSQGSSGSFSVCDISASLYSLCILYS